MSKDEAARKAAEAIRYQRRVERDRQWAAVAELARLLAAKRNGSAEGGANRLSTSLCSAR